MQNREKVVLNVGNLRRQLIGKESLKAEAKGSFEVPEVSESQAVRNVSSERLRRPIPSRGTWRHSDVSGHIH